MGDKKSRRFVLSAIVLDEKVVHQIDIPYEKFNKAFDSFHGRNTFQGGVDYDGHVKKSSQAIMQLCAEFIHHLYPDKVKYIHSVSWETME